MTVPVLCIDGPNASGKGAVSRAVAERLGWHRLDSGVLYRGLGLAAARRSLAPTESARLARLAADLDLELRGDRVLLEGRDVTREVGTEEAGTGASRVAAARPGTGRPARTPARVSAPPRGWSPTDGTWGRWYSPTRRGRCF